MKIGRHGGKWSRASRAGVAILLILLGWLCARVADADALATRDVLVLFSEERFIPANLAVKDSVQAALTAGSAEPIEFFTEFLEPTRFPGEQQEQVFQQFLREKYADRKLAVLIAVGAPALEFLVKYRATLFPDTPIVFCGVEQREIDALAIGPRIIGVPAQVDFTGTLELALRLQPDTQRVVVVSGAAAMDRRREAEARQLFRPYEDRLAFTYLTGLPMPDLLRELAHLPEHTVVIYLNILRDGAGTAFVPRDVLEQLGQAANAPIYSLFETYLGHGIVGGRLLSFAQQGKQAARLGLRILAGEQPAAIAVPEAVPNIDSVDWRQLRRWDINEDRLPPGSSVQFKEPSVWDQYRWRIIGAIALCLSEALLIVALLVQQRRRRQAEKALRDSEERMNLAAASAELGMWWWDIARDQIEATEKCRALYGFAPAVPLNYQAFLNTLHPDDREPTHQAIQQVLAEQTEFHGEYRVVRPDGSLRWLAAKGRGYFDSAGKPLRMLGVSIDVTERKQVELEAQRQRQELAHMMRVVTLGELSTAFAHELNQPLTAILSNAQAAQRFLAHGRLEVGDLNAILADIVAAAQRASEVIGQVRAMLKKGEVQRQPLDINAIIREVSKLIHSDLITRQVSLVMTLDTTLPGVTGDSIQLQQVILNLLLNGAEAMLASASRPRQLEVRTTRPDAATIEVSVHDTGVGIDPQQVEHIFEPFVTTKPHGLGMGLAISRSIIAAHGGRLWAENHPEGGATFRFTLPADTGAPAC